MTDVALGSFFGGRKGGTVGAEDGVADARQQSVRWEERLPWAEMAWGLA